MHGISQQAVDLYDRFSFRLGVQRCMLRIVTGPFRRLFILLVCTLLGCLSSSRQGLAQTMPAPTAPDALKRLVALHLPRLEGPVPVYYSDGLRTLAMRDRAEIADCAAWYSQQLGVSVPVTLAVLNHADWDRVDKLMTYPMAQALADEGNVIFMPDSFATFPGQNSHMDLNKKLDFISFHETGHLYQRALHLEGPDLFMQEFSATMLATAYALVRRPELIDATLASRDGRKQRYTSFEDIDLIYEGVGFDNYDWLQVETVRLAVFFVKGQNLKSLVSKMQAAFPAGSVMSNKQVFAALDSIRPGTIALAGSLADPTTLKQIKPTACLPSPPKEEESGFFGVRNEAGHDIPVVDGGVDDVLHPGYTAEHGTVGSQLKLPSGNCITYRAEPGYVVLQ